MCDRIGKLQSADDLRSNAGLSICYRPDFEILEQQRMNRGPNPAMTLLVVANWRNSYSGVP
jgi:hypothetical protein